MNNEDLNAALNQYIAVTLELHQAELALVAAQEVHKPLVERYKDALRALNDSLLPKSEP